MSDPTFLLFSMVVVYAVAAGSLLYIITKVYEDKL